MAHTNSTANYNLPQWIGSDKPTFLGDLNSAFTEIDSQLKVNADNTLQVVDDIESTKTLATTNKSNLEALTQKVADAEGSITETNAKVTANETSISSLTETLTGLNTAIQGKQDKITGAATSILTTNLTTDKVLVSDSNGKVSNSSVSASELGVLSGISVSIPLKYQIKYIYDLRELAFKQNITTSDSVVAINTLFSSFKYLIFVLYNNANEIVDNVMIPTSEFEAHNLYLKTVGYESPVGTDLILVSRIDDRRFSVRSMNGWKTSVRVYGYCYPFQDAQPDTGEIA